MISYCVCENDGTSLLPRFRVDYYGPKDNNCENEIEGRILINVDDECNTVSATICNEEDMTFMVQIKRRDFITACGEFCDFEQE